MTCRTVTPHELHIPADNTLSRLPLEEIAANIRQCGAQAPINCVNWPDAFPDARRTTVYAAHDDDAVYLLFDCEGFDLKAETDADLGPVANDSCVEFFVSPDTADPRYWNFEFNAIGRKNVSTRITRPEPRRLSVDELSQIKVYSSAGESPFAEQNGFHTWYLLVVIPFSLFTCEKYEFPKRMKGNFYKCGAKTSSPHYLSWAPIATERPDFHRPEFFADIILD